MHFARPLIFSIRQLINTLLSLTNHNKIMNPCEALTAAARQGRGGKSWPSSIFQKVRRHNTGNYVLSAEGIPHAFCQRCLIRAPAYHPGQAGAKDKAFWTLYILWNFIDLVQARPSLTRKTKIYLFFCVSIQRRNHLLETRANRRTPTTPAPTSCFLSKSYRISLSAFMRNISNPLSV